MCQMIQVGKDVKEKKEKNSNYNAFLGCKNISDLQKGKTAKQDCQKHAARRDTIQYFCSWMIAKVRPEPKIWTQARVLRSPTPVENVNVYRGSLRQKQML